MLLTPMVGAFLVAVLSVADMFLPRPYDGVVLESDAPGARVVRQVVPGSGADVAGIRPGDVIVGIDRTLLNSTTHAQQLLNDHRIGERVPYLVRSQGRVSEVEVELGRRTVGDTAYLLACVLGFTFFIVGVFVVVRQPRLPATRAFATMCSLFLLFLVCRLRPASYSWVDSLVLTTGTVALLFLPAAFLHFFLIFPRPVWEWRRDPIARVLGWVARRSRTLLPFYLFPPLVYGTVVLWSQRAEEPLALISGAPAANWWLMVGYMALGLGGLGLSARYLPDVRQRRGAGLVFVGTVVGVVPFVVLAVGFPSFLHTERFLFWGVLPLFVVPLTFAYAIIRFQLMDIRVILRKSLLYTLTTAVVTAAYALGIACFNLLFRGTEIAASPLFPVLFALAIVLLFEPLRQRIQGPVDRFFFAERLRLQEAMVEMGEAFAVQHDLEAVVRQLVTRLPELLGLHFAGLYLVHGSEMERVAGPRALPDHLPKLPLLLEHLRKNGSLLRLGDLAPLRLISDDVQRCCETLAGCGVEMVGLLASSRRFLGVVVLSGTSGQTMLEREEVQLLRGLLQQASIALETSILLEETARQAELEGELRIAAAIQASLLPASLEGADGWQMAAVCRPAKEVGGDFYTELPRPDDSERAVVYGDVSGKSISAALVMMAAHEVLHALAHAYADPERLLKVANDRLHRLRGQGSALQVGSFVALGYLGFGVGTGRLRYSLAGQPPPMLVRDGSVRELELPRHRIPLGALEVGGHRVLELEMRPGDVVVAYSDGVVEAQSPDGEFFGDERLAEVLAASDGSPDATVASVLEAVERFAAGSAQYDDITLVAARWTGDVAPGEDETSSPASP